MGCGLAEPIWGLERALGARAAAMKGRQFEAVLAGPVPARKSIGSGPL
jgi:hypothetical protein